MSFFDTLTRARAWLREHGRVSINGLKREFGLDDDGVAQLIEELVDVQQVAVRQGGVLAWTGSGDDVDSATSRESAPDMVAERRQLTVLFCDLVDSTSLAAGRDPEDWRDIVVAYQRAIGAVIDRFDGHVAQYLGDGILAYFGYPRAHENDAERAVRAAIGMVQSLPALNRELTARGGPAIAIRVGIHTGPVVVGEMGGGAGRRETLALGDTTNVAARLQGEAEPDIVVVSPATLKLVQGIFVTRDLGERALKGVAEPVRVTQAVRPSGMRSRLDVAGASGLTPLVGRAAELMQLEAHYASASEGCGRAVLLSGDPGIGKSRIVQSFRDALSSRPHSWLECRTSPYTMDSAFFPVLELQRQGLGFDADDDAGAKIERLEASLRDAGFDLDDVMPLAAHFHSLPLPDRYVPLTVNPEAVRRRTLDFLRDWLLRIGRAQTVVLLVEDLHWIDPSTLELIDGIIAHIDAAPMLLLMTHRPEFAPPWQPDGHAVSLALSRLVEDDIAELVRSTARGGVLAEELIAEVVRRSDGVPLFAEELARAVVASVATSPGATTHPRIPETLQDSLMARLDALGPVKELAQLASVLGREFDHDLLHAVSALDDADLEASLDTAVREELFYRDGDPPAATYLFKHALIRDAAYQSMVRPVRRHHHRRVADTLVERTAGGMAAPPELVAHHFEEADLSADAVRYYRLAGEQAQARSAHKEAIQHLQRALNAFRRLPDADERPDEELAIRIALGNSAQTLHGFAGPIVREMYEQAARLSRSLSPIEQVYAVRGHAVYQTMTGDFPGAFATLRELDPLADRIGPPERATIANLLGLATWQIGNLTEALRILEESVAVYDPQYSRELIARSGIEVAVTTIGWASQLQWFAGRPDLATARARQAVDRAREVDHPLTLSFMLVFAAIVESYCGRFDNARAFAQEGLALSERHDIPYFGAYHTLTLSSLEPASADSVQRAQQALAEASKEGAVVNAPVVLSLLADMLHRAGACAESLGVLQMARGAAQQYGMHLWDAELFRQEADARIALDPAADVEPIYRAAIEFARTQGARSLELRSALALARLWRGQGRTREAYELLAPVHAGFTEGFDTLDVSTASALLEQWSDEVTARPGQAARQVPGDAVL